MSELVPRVPEGEIRITVIPRADEPSRPAVAADTNVHKLSPVCYVAALGAAAGMAERMLGEFLAGMPEQSHEPLREIFGLAAASSVARRATDESASIIQRIERPR
jgi:hypothetical protein